MSFWDDAGGGLATVLDIGATPLTAVFGAAEHNAHIPMVGQFFGGFKNLYTAPSAYLRGQPQQGKQEFMNFGKSGAIFAAAYTGGAAAGLSASSAAQKGTLSTSTLASALGVNADVANYFPDLNTGSKTNKDKNAPGYQTYETGAPATPFRLPDNAGDYTIPIVIAGGVALLAVLLIKGKK